MRTSLPKDPIVLLVRKRDDFDDLYRLVNDRALWTNTTRAVLDNPIAETRCDGHHGEELRREFLGDIQTVEALIGMLRG